MERDGIGDRLYRARTTTSTLIEPNLLTYSWLPCSRYLGWSAQWEYVLRWLSRVLDMWASRGAFWGAAGMLIGDCIGPMLEYLEISSVTRHREWKG